VKFALNNDLLFKNVGNGGLIQAIQLPKVLVEDVVWVNGLVSGE